MNKLSNCFILGFLLLTITTLSCSLPIKFLDWTKNATPGETEAWQVSVDELRVMTRSQPIPTFLTDPEQPAGGDVFDPNQLMEPLTTLHLQPGYTLDFIYQFDGMGGSPILYARRIADPPFEVLADYTDFMEECQALQGTGACDYMRYINCEDTPQGYFEWVLLQEMGGQFYLYWHSGYRETEIIASRERLEVLAAGLKEANFGIPLTASQYRKALKIDPAPVVNMGDEEVTVRVVWFTNWGGFYESVYTIDRNLPHQVLNVETEQLLEYECGVMF